MGKFAKDITAWVEKTKLSGGLVMQKLGLDAHKGILLRSPVHTGRFRASNRVGVNRVDLTVEPEFDSNIGSSFGASPSAFELSQAAALLRGVKWLDTIHVTNNLPYAKPLENGSSAQNGRRVDGIYGATFQELRANLDAAVRAARLA